MTSDFFKLYISTYHFVPNFLQFPRSTESIFFSSQDTSGPALNNFIKLVGVTSLHLEFGTKPYVPRSKLVWFLYRIVTSWMVGIYIIIYCISVFGYPL